MEVISVLDTVKLDTHYLLEHTPKHTHALTLKHASNHLQLSECPRGVIFTTKPATFIMMQGKLVIIIIVSSNSFNYLQTHTQNICNICAVWLLMIVTGNKSSLPHSAEALAAENRGCELKGSLRF